LGPAGVAGCLEPELEPRSEHLGQARVPHLALRLLDVVLDAAEGRVLCVEVEQQIRRVWVAVPWLADRSRIEERPNVAELELAAVRRDAACELVAGLDDLQRNVAVAQKGGTSLCVGWKTELDAIQIREQMKKILTLWAS